MIKMFFIFIISLSILSAQEKTHSFYIELNIPFVSQISLQNGLEDSIFYDSLIQGNHTNYSKGYYNTKWKNFDSYYSLFSFVYFQNKQNWFLGFKSKSFNTKYSYRRLYLNDDMKNFYKYQKSRAWLSFSYYDLFYGKKFTYKDLSVFPYLSIRSNHFSNRHVSVPFPINIKDRNNDSIRFVANYTNYIPNLYSLMSELLTSTFLIDTLPNIHIERLMSESKSYNFNLGYKIEKKISNSVKLFFEMSSSLFSIGKGDRKDSFLSYEKKDDDTDYFGKSSLDYETKISSYEIGMAYTVYKNLSLLSKFSHDILDTTYTNYKGILIEKTEKELNIPLNELFTNTFFYNQSYKSYNSNISFGVSFKI